MRSQGGPGAGAALTALPTGRETTFPSHLFHVILFRRLRQPPPFTGRACRCGRLIDPNAASSTPMAIIAQHVPELGCSVAEVLRWKVQLPESAERQVVEWRWQTKKGRI